MPLAMMMGQEPSSTPYISQSNTPAVKKVYMRSEMSLVCLVRHTRQTCGMNEQVVNVAAAAPMIS